MAESATLESFDHGAGASDDNGPPTPATPPIPVQNTPATIASPPQISPDQYIKFPKLAQSFVEQLEATSITTASGTFKVCSATVRENLDSYAKVNTTVNTMWKRVLRNNWKLSRTGHEVDGEVWPAGIHLYVDYTLSGGATFEDVPRETSIPWTVDETLAPGVQTYQPASTSSQVSISSREFGRAIRNGFKALIRKAFHCARRDAKTEGMVRDVLGHGVATVKRMRSPPGTVKVEIIMMTTPVLLLSISEMVTDYFRYQNRKVAVGLVGAVCGAVVAYKIADDQSQDLWVIGGAVVGGAAAGFGIGDYAVALFLSRW
ncbi:hypothetical protein M427DRAFT_35394 [Gonapodya prolifera JEL478]|uniref:Uncharacterized protein n=1 Tax=Gonapodya prolifera (strain JEL478) TaxID=1344416 RepID=A0A139A5R0_GONPJ|nr:hypothetical protein M427DRAFT_35394 [Gonapodya prolifera JEL478]|eukprot:KXS11815.1 hypothetical protein M427DRAFT_35394 [Gonapodya prolifera JEL478]